MIKFLKTSPSLRTLKLSATASYEPDLRGQQRQQERNFYLSKEVLFATTDALLRAAFFRQCQSQIETLVCDGFMAPEALHQVLTLQQHSRLKDLTVNLTSLDNEMAYTREEQTMLSSAIGENSFVERLSLFVNRTNAHIVNETLQRLAANPFSCLRVLHLNTFDHDVEIQFDHFVALSRLLQATQTLQHLTFDTYLFHPESMDYLLLGGLNRQRLAFIQTLCLERCKLTRGATNRLQEYMQRPHTNGPALRVLYIEECIFMRDNEVQQDFEIQEEVLNPGQVVASFVSRKSLQDPSVIMDTIGSQLYNLSIHNDSFVHFLEATIADTTIVKLPALTVRGFGFWDDEDELALLERLTELQSAVTTLRELNLEIHGHPSDLNIMVGSFKVNGSICKLSITCSKDCRDGARKGMELLSAYSMRNEHLSSAFSKMHWCQDTMEQYDVHCRKKIRRANTNNCDSIASTLHLFPSLLQAAKQVPRTACSTLLKNLMAFQMVVVVDEPARD